MTCTGIAVNALSRFPEDWRIHNRDQMHCSHKGEHMNTYRDAILLLSLPILPLVLLSMSATYFPSVGLSALAWLASMTALVIVLRTVNTAAPRRIHRPSRSMAVRLHSDSQYQRLKARGLR